MHNWHRKTLISVRIDDACPQMDEERFYRMVSDIERFGIKGLIGIVPDCRDPKLLQQPEDEHFWARMRALQESGWVLAMHGACHTYDVQARSMVSSSLNSEFASHSYETQYQKLLDGKNKLLSYGIETDVFFAPGHSYDKNTLRALKTLGFRYVSDGRSRRCYHRFGLKFIPCRVYGPPQSAKGIVTLALHPCAVQGIYQWPLDYMKKNRKYLVDYATLLQAEEGISWIQIINEQLYVFFVRHLQPWLWPALARCKRIIVSAISRPKQ